MFSSTFRIHLSYASTHASINCNEHIVYIFGSSQYEKRSLKFHPTKLNREKERNIYQVNWFITIFVVYLTAFVISDFIVFFFKWSVLLGKFTCRKILNRNILHERVLVG